MPAISTVARSHESLADSAGTMTECQSRWPGLRESEDSTESESLGIMQVTRTWTASEPPRPTVTVPRQQAAATKSF
jgi:hypothetical protein